MSPTETTIAMILVVGAIALVMRWFTGNEGAGKAREADPVDELLAEVSGASVDDVADVVALTSDGWAFVPDGDEVQLIPPGDADDTIPVRSEHMTGYQPQTDPDIQVLGGQGGPVNPRTHKPVPQWKPGMHLDRGDLTAVRVRRGEVDHDPWRVETIGRDGDYNAWFFETEPAARAAADLLERRIVVPPRDEFGDPRPVPDSEFDEARRRDEETERALDSGEE